MAWVFALLLNKKFLLSMDRSGSSGDIVCQVFTEYTRACAHAGHPLHNWRTHFPLCGM